MELFSDDIGKDWKMAWLTGPDEDNVLMVDLAKGEQVAPIDVPGEPHGLALSPDGKLAYVVQRKLNQLAMSDTAARSPSTCQAIPQVRLSLALPPACRIA